MLRRAALPVLAASVLFLVSAAAACSSSGTAGTSSAGVTTTVPATTTTLTTAPPTLVPQPDPTAAANALIDAWKAGDQVTAATVAAPEAVQVLFLTGTPTSVEARGCSDAKYDPAQCVFRTDLGEVQIRTTMQGDGWVVDQARISAP